MVTKKAFVLGITVNDSFTLSFVDALNELDFNVELLTYDPSLDHKTALRIHGKNITAPWSSLSSSGLRSKRIRDFSDLSRHIGLRGKGLVVNTVANSILIPSDVAYIHFLHFSVAIPNMHHLARSWRVSLTTMDKIGAVIRARVLRYMLLSSKIILVNSSFTKRVVKEILGLDSLVNFPPTIIKHEQNLSSLKRKNCVVTISRFSKEKRLERILAIAEKVKDAKFYLIGLLWDVEYYQKLVMMAKKLSLDNIVFLPDLPRDKLIYHLRRSKVYLHAMPYEHFGLAVVEGMAHGLIPMVHKSGGPWENVLGGIQGRYGFAYEHEDEAAFYINELLDNEQLRTKISERSSERALMFSEKRFKQRVKDIVQSIYS